MNNCVYNLAIISKNKKIDNRHNYPKCTKSNIDKYDYTIHWLESTYQPDRDKRYSSQTSILQNPDQVKSK